MKKAMLIIILSAILTGCGMTENTAKEEPIAVTSAVSQTSTTAAETASETVTTSETTTTTKAVTTANTTSTSKTTTTTKTETTTSKSTTRKAVSESTTTKQPTQQTEAQTYIVYYDEPSPETQQTQPEVKVTEAKPITTTTVQTTPPTVTTKETTTTTQTSTTTAEPYTEPQKMNVTEHWLIYFSDSHSKDYYVNIGKSLANDGSDCGKAEAVFEYMQSEFSGERNCIYMSSIAYCLCEGIGLDCGYAMMSDWYHHCANAVKVDGVWYVLDTQAGGFLCEDIGYTKVIDEYENILDVRLSECDY